MRSSGNTRNNSVSLNVEASFSSETSGCRSTKEDQHLFLNHIDSPTAPTEHTDNLSQWTCWRRPPGVSEDKTAVLSAPPQFNTWGWKQIEFRKRHFLLGSLEDGQEKRNLAIPTEQLTSFHSIFLQFFVLFLSPSDCRTFRSATAVHV
jgi:hypothetical protein